jgi:hypothetical protein
LRLRTIKWDFNTSPPGKEWSHRFEITNSTANLWTLKRVTPNCACTVGTLSAKTIPPGETASLQVTYRVPLHDGRVAAHVMVEFAEPTSPIIQLTIEGEVRGLLVADPPSLVFEYSPAGTPSSQTIALRSRSDQRVAITRVESPPWLRTEWRAAEDRVSDGQPQQTWELVVHASPERATDRDLNTAMLVVHTDSEQVGPAYIPVRRKTALEASPDRLAFGAVKPGETRLMKVALRTDPAVGELTEKDLVLTHNLGDALDIQVHRETPRLFLLLVRFQPKRPQGSVEGELEIKTLRKTIPPVRVRLSAISQ